jgi:hypothetical protein
MNNNWFAVMWDHNGLEACKSITHPHEVTLALLQGKSIPVSPNLNHWRLRASFNPQRFYEIYLIAATDDITENDIVDMFTADPQTAADTIRRIGTKFYSNRNTSKPKII